MRRPKKDRSLTRLYSAIQSLRGACRGKDDRQKGVLRMLRGCERNLQKELTRTRTGRRFSTWNLPWWRFGQLDEGLL